MAGEWEPVAWEADESAMEDLRDGGVVGRSVYSHSREEWGDIYLLTKDRWLWTNRLPGFIRRWLMRWSVISVSHPEAETLASKSIWRMP